MKLSAIIALVAATLAIASPAAVSLNRSFLEVRDEDGTVSEFACVECPCPGFTGECICIPNGCCAPKCIQG
ncbi:hypothetical protein IQ07DRAFT_380228 [Pyrenochaeta sp. DS3sAY3a]|nr:hypothetical protein IQ07DRAFT_380228 [Pyrenochaeta sp. DS3sAY3a]